MRRILLTVEGACLLIGTVASSQAAEWLFLLDWLFYGKHVPFFAAKDFGFFKNEGLDIKIERGFGSVDTAKRVAAKAAPFSFADAGVELMTQYTPLAVRIKTDELYTNKFLPQVAVPKM